MILWLVWRQCSVTPPLVTAIKRHTYSVFARRQLPAALKRAVPRSPCRVRGTPSTEAGRGTSGYCMERPARAESISAHKRSPAGLGHGLEVATLLRASPSAPHPQRYRPPAASHGTRREIPASRHVRPAR